MFFDKTVDGYVFAAQSLLNFPKPIPISGKGINKTLNEKASPSSDLILMLDPSLCGLQVCTKGIDEQSENTDIGYTLQSFDENGQSDGGSRCLCRGMLDVPWPIDSRTGTPGRVVESGQGIELDQRMKISEHEIPRKVN